MDNKNNPVFSSIDEEKDTFKPIETSNDSKIKNQLDDVFAKGLPDWDLVPGNVVVRRHQ